VALRTSSACDLIELNGDDLRREEYAPVSALVHPMQGDEMRALRRLQRERGPSSHVFMTERTPGSAVKSWSTALVQKQKLRVVNR